MHTKWQHTVNTASTFSKTFGTALAHGLVLLLLKLLLLHEARNNMWKSFCNHVNIRVCHGHKGIGAAPGNTTGGD